MNYFFCSDSHFFHSNIIKYCNRPFVDAHEMNETIIHNWNVKVRDDDIVYFLGDFAFGNEKCIADLLFRLKGNIKILFGNHDKTLRKFAANDFKSAQYYVLHKRIEFLGDYKEINILGQPITLAHYSMKVWNGSHRGAWHLYGHSHGSLPDDPHSLSFDCGVDCHNFTPINFEQVAEIMKKKLWKPIDHHGDRQESGGVGLSKADYDKLDRKRLYDQLKMEFNPEFSERVGRMRSYCLE